MQSNQINPLANQVATEKIVHSLPTAVHETVKPSQLEEVQPIVHRQIEKTEIHQITQPIYESNVLPTQVSNVVLPTQQRPDVHLGGAVPAMTQDVSTRQVQTSAHSTIVKPALVENVVRGHIIEEVQPVVYREVIAPSIVQTTQNINEHIYEAPVVTKSVAAPIYSTGTSMPMATGFAAPMTSGLGQQPHGHHPFGIGIPLAQRPAFYDNKAAIARQNGNLTKANRNQEKSMKAREKLARRSAPGYSRKVRTPGLLPAHHTQRVGLYETRATNYERSGDHQRALRNRQKSNFLRSKYGVAPVNYPVSNFGAAPTTVLPGQAGHQFAPAGVHGSRIGLRGLEKAQFFENKAAEWQRAGNLTKANRNHEKASKIRAKLADSSKPSATKARTPGVLSERQAAKIAKFEQRAALADSNGKTRKAINARERANHVRTKSGVPHTQYPGMTTGTRAF